MKPTLHQNVIAMVWDFDLTLIPVYMQQPLFNRYGIDEQTFWRESNALVRKYAEKGVRVNRDTSYLNHLLSYVSSGRCQGLSNQVLRELGRDIVFFPGIPDFLRKSKQLIESNETYKKYGIRLEHYVISTGLVEMIRGSAIADYIEDVWGCEFMEDEGGEICSIAYSLDNTTKTRALFEINKGVNKYPEEINVNQRMVEEDRRVPFVNMIYIADGPSDVPAFSVVKKGGGKGYAVYQRDEAMRSFKQAKSLHDDGRVDHFGEADYTDGSHTHMWLTQAIREIADNIVTVRKARMSEGKDNVPGHLI